MGDLPLPEYDVIREIVLATLLEHNDGITLNRLARKSLESLTVSSRLNKKQAEKYIQAIVYDLKNIGIIENVPNTYPLQLRPLKKGRESLLQATRQGDTTTVTRLLREEIAQETKDAALISAVINNHTEIARLLIEAGADVNATDELFNKTPLMYISGSTHKELADLIRIAANNSR